MSRIGRVTFEQIACSTFTDLVEISPVAPRMIRVLHRWVGCTDNNIPAAQMFALRERYLPATVTHGSGGSTPQVGSLDPGDPLTTATIRCNSTAKATTSATAVILWEDGAHLYNGYDDALDEPYVIPAGAAYVFELLTAFSPAVHLSGGVTFEEIGG
jgi:hypothetical protein